MKRNILLNPGPGTTSREVKRALIVPDICPREKEFGDLMKSISNDLIKIVHATPEEYACVLFSGSGTAAMEATITSVVRGKVLIINNGAYGERMAEIARIHNIPHRELIFDREHPINIEEIEDTLNKDNFGYLAMVHHETTTGILNPIDEVGIIAKKHDCVLIVDAVSSFAGIPINIKSQNIDFLFSTSNKCIQGMPGIFFVICKKEELMKLKDRPKRTLYLDLYSQYKLFEKEKQMQFTPPVQIFYALKKAIEEYFEEGERERYVRYMHNWRHLINGMFKLGFVPLIRKEFQSGLLTTFWEMEGVSFDEMHDYLYERGFTIYPGKLDKKKTFRLANMGAITSKDINKFLKTMREFLCQKK